MGCAQNLIFAFPLLILLISTTSHLRLFDVEGRKLSQTPHKSQTSLKEEKAMWRAQIGSRPPRCERRCGSCARCEAIQVPTNGRINSSGAVAVGVAGARDQGASNYKPMSWKCKCGNLIFNP
ncbi:EPIDERMAL PATTERNING FACTOR-like protein 2 [Salvia miltiorrhiza]|uniref:EPIDERMAL PATTERNING FACTOR-like protein 2 n=1 Tax=Salvia miltiorrhiza TaxID=226208 RepID=UPI0025AC5ECD|nr:EPIDERMAL PATTERNING FACTOR-like protein 2 [Salvia miltiorrhiza]